MNLLLDTSAFLWLLSAPDRLPERVRGIVRQREHEVYLSVASFWEILIKYHLGKLPLPAPPVNYIPYQRQQHLIESLPLHEETLRHLPHLPSVHRDPFDRILICQAIEHNLTLATADPKIRAYPIKTCWD